MVERLIQIDQALLYLVTGALDYLVLKEPLEETGALTPETAKNALSVALEIYLNERDFMIPIGTIMLYGAELAPPGWILCDGIEVSRVTYADLFAVIGIFWGDGDGTTTFNLPNFIDRSPMGRGAYDIGQTAGEFTHTLTTNEIPAHEHYLLLRGSGTAGGANNRVNAPTQTTVASNLVTDSTGGGQQHNNLHPIIGINFMIYAGV